MADELLKRDKNHKTVQGAVTNDASQEIRMIRVDPITGGTIVDGVVGLKNDAGITINPSTEEKQNFLFEVAKGNVPGHSIQNVFGHNPAVGDPAESLWEEGGAYVFPPSASTMTVSSSDTDDTLLGAGARTVLVKGLDTDYNEISETIEMDGQDGVTTQNSYLRLRSLIVLTVGASGFNQGSLYIGTGTITTGKPAVVYCNIGATENISHFGIYTVPAGKTAFLWSSTTSVESGKFVEILIYTRNLATQPFLQANELSMFQAALFEQFDGAFEHTEKSDVDYRGLVASTTADVKRRNTFILVDN